MCASLITSIGIDVYKRDIPGDSSHDVYRPPKEHYFNSLRIMGNLPASLGNNTTQKQGLVNILAMPDFADAATSEKLQCLSFLEFKKYSVGPVEVLLFFSILVIGAAVKACQRRPYAGFIWVRRV
jgi:hypothetical protein